jgi:hypothetical protein
VLLIIEVVEMTTALQRILVTGIFKEGNCTISEAFVRFENKEVLDTDKSKIICGSHICNSTNI